MPNIAEQIAWMQSVIREDFQTFVWHALDLGASTTLFFDMCTFNLQPKTKQNRLKRNKSGTKQNKTEQNTTKQNKTKQQNQKHKVFNTQRAAFGFEPIFCFVAHFTRMMSFHVAPCT